MPTIWKRRDPKGAVDIQAKAQKRLAAMKEAGNISGRTQKEADDEQAIDAIFDTTQETEEPDDRSAFQKSIDWLFD